MQIDTRTPPWTHLRRRLSLTRQRRLLTVVTALGMACALWAVSLAVGLSGMRRDLRCHRTLDCMNEAAVALGRVARNCGEFPVSPGARVALGDDCRTAGVLVQRLVRMGDLSEPLVCDAFDQPYLIQGLASPPDGALSTPDGPPVSLECRTRYGEEWSKYVVLISAGSDATVAPDKGRYDHASEGADTVMQGFSDGPFYVVSGITGIRGYPLAVGIVGQLLWGRAMRADCAIRWGS